MLVFIIPLILLVVFIYLLLVSECVVVPFWINKKKYEQKYGTSYMNDYHDYDVLSPFSTIFIIIFGVWFLIAGINLIDRERWYDQIVNEYTVLSTQASQNCDLLVLGNNGSFIKDVDAMNDRINNHKAYLNSPWNGIYKSEKIANLKPIVFSGLSACPPENFSVTIKKRE